VVAAGPYRWVRNPIYLAALLVVLGEAGLLESLRLLAYAGVMAVFFHLFVTGYEERTLRRRFGRGYLEYRHTVPRWIPRRPSRHRGRSARLRAGRGKILISRTDGGSSSSPRHFAPAARTAVVIAIGNDFRRDDGAGPAVLHQLRDLVPPGVDLVLTDGEPARLVEAWTGASLDAIGLALALDRMPGRLIVHAIEAAGLTQGPGLSAPVAAAADGVEGVARRRGRCRGDGWPSGWRAVFGPVTSGVGPGGQ
jgi:Phospholipid methyltransferase